MTWNDNEVMKIDARSNPILGIKPLHMPWETADPFLFCVHHLDQYPAGNDQMGPIASLAGRNLGQDFSGQEGWSMYHGDVIPGFPQHPHRGFETVTITRRGIVDHSDSLGAQARFGNGDVQWLTAGKGIVHSEMFPLLDREAPNPLELFQIWLNLPRADKMVEPHFKMYWSQELPSLRISDPNGRVAEISIIAGSLTGAPTPLAPPPHSWATRPEADVAIWLIRMEAEAIWTLPAASAGSNRSLYFYSGNRMTIGEQPVSVNHSVALRGEAEVSLLNGPGESQLLLLQGQPIREPVFQHGPFVMNSRTEIIEAFQDYQRTQFGGWPCPSDGPAHGRDKGRFAKHVDGRVEIPELK
jgi:redox-sensitive bicupin YhaK (pirin superfamily)